MKSLWGWALLWLLSAYGLVRLLLRVQPEPQPVLDLPPAGPVRSVDSPSDQAPSDEAPAEGPAGELGAMEGTPAEASPADPELPGPSPEPPAVEELTLAIPATDTGVLHGNGSEAEVPEPVTRVSDGAADDPDTSSALAALVEDEGALPVRPLLDLGALTLGMSGVELLDRYGPPGHMSKLGMDGEQWRYPLHNTDTEGHDRGDVVVLEFQRGHLVSKALEAGEEEEVHAAVPAQDAEPTGEETSHGEDAPAAQVATAEVLPAPEVALAEAQPVKPDDPEGIELAPAAASTSGQVHAVEVPPSTGEGLVVRSGSVVHGEEGPVAEALPEGVDAILPPSGGDRSP